MTESAVTVLRALDPLERYFWLLGQVEGMNVVTFAELDRQLDPDEIRGALAALQACHPLLRARVEIVDDDYVFAATPAPIPLTIRPVDPRGWMSDVLAEVDTPLGPSPDPLCRVVYLPFIDDNRSVLLLTINHVVIDGRSICTVMQQILNHIENGGAGDPAVAELPGPPTEAFPEEFRSARVRVDVMRQVQQERKGQPEAVAFPFHQRRVVGRQARIDLLEIFGDEMEHLRDRTRAAGTSLYGFIAAVALQSANALFADVDDRVLTLVSTADLRYRMDPPLPEDGVCVAVGMLSTPHLVTSQPDPGLAARIAEQTRREVARGESHLFPKIVRASSYPASDEGVARFTEWIGTTPQNVTVSNVGVITDRGDPSWVSSINPVMGTSPNQLIFVALTTYRSRLVMTVMSDAAKLDDDLAERFVEGLIHATEAHRVSFSDQ